MDTSITVQDFHPVKQLCTADTEMMKLAGYNFSELLRAACISWYHMPTPTIPDDGDLFKTIKDESPEFYAVAFRDPASMLIIWMLYPNSNPSIIENAAIVAQYLAGNGYTIDINGYLLAVQHNAGVYYTFEKPIRLFKVLDELKTTIVLSKGSKEQLAPTPMESYRSWINYRFCERVV